MTLKEMARAWWADFAEPDFDVDAYAEECASTVVLLREVQSQERARIVAILRREAEKRDAQAERVVRDCPDAFCAMSGPASKLREAEREQYRQFAHFANELRHVADIIEGGGE